MAFHQNFFGFRPADSAVNNRLLRRNKFAHKQINIAQIVFAEHNAVGNITIQSAAYRIANLQLHLGAQSFNGI